MMSLIQVAYVLARRRIISGWRLETVLFLGILLAVALLSSGVVFSDLLAEAALRRALDEATPEDANLAVGMYNYLDNPATLQGRRSAYLSSVNFVEDRVGPRFEPYVTGSAQLLKTDTFFYMGHPHLELSDNIRPRGKFTYMTGLISPETSQATGSHIIEDRIRIVEGRWPYSTTTGLPPSDAPLEVAVDTLGAELLQLGVGGEMSVFPATSKNNTLITQVRIVGIFEKVNPDDQFWYGTNRAFSSRESSYPWATLFTTEEAILHRVAGTYPGLYVDADWFFYLDRLGVRAGEVGHLQDAIFQVERDVLGNLENSNTSIKLDEVLDDYEEQLLLARIPLFLMLFLVVGILIYYLVLVAGLIVRSRSTEISMLKSRGSTTVQVGLMMLVEGMLLAVPAIALGPLLALGVGRALGQFFFDEAVRGDTGIPITLSGNAYLLGIAGAALAVVVLAVSTLVVARHSIVEFRQAGARPSSAPFIHRYYLDVLMLILIGLIWWQIQTRGSFLVRSLGSGELELDYTLLLGPVLGLLALGLLVLRFFPIGVGILARALEPVGPAWLAQGLRRVSRDPIVPGTLVVLLMMATALGVIGSAFSSTLERSQKERALYTAGATDARLHYGGDSIPFSILGLSDLVAGGTDVNGQPPAEGAAEVRRTAGSMSTEGFNPPNLDILAVDTERFDRVAWYRPDFAGGKPLAEIINAIAPGPDSIVPLKDGITLPENITGIALSVYMGRPDSQTSLLAKIQDSRGYYFNVVIGQLGFRGWERLEAEFVPFRIGGRFRGVPQVSFLTPTPPYNLLSIHMYNAAGVVEPGDIFFGELSAITPDGDVMVDDFQDLSRWSVVQDFTRPDPGQQLYVLEPSQSITIDSTPGGGSGGASSARFSWVPGGRGLRGIRAGNPETPIPALVSQSFLDQSDLELGEPQIILMSSFALQIRPVAVAKYFPTLDPSDGPFILVDLETFNHYSNLHYERSVGGSNELWVNLNGFQDTGSLDSGAGQAAGPSAEDVITALNDRGVNVTRTNIASELVAQRVDRPLVNASWGGLLVLMFLALVLASASGVMLFSYMDTRERQTEYALLRTLGFSRGQLNGVVWFNLFLMVVCGVGLGTLAGVVIGNSLLPILEVAEEGVRVTPPMVLQTNWFALLISYLILAAVTVITVGWLAWIITKLEVQRVLRAGEA